VTLPRVLVVDDNHDMADGIALVLRELPAEVETVYSADAACAAMEKAPADLVMSDVRMPGRDGLELLDLLVKQWPRAKVVMITAHGSIDAAVAAMKRGACDYVTKPFHNQELSLVAGRALRERGLEDDARALRSQAEKRDVFEGMVGRDARMLVVFESIKKVAPTDATVLVAGEHGTGKELVARAVHRLSGRAGAFIAFNAAAVPENLVEAELFGSRKGAFTGADRDRKGHFLEADGGTLFIDEVGSMPASMQVKLLRALQEREVVPVGASAPVKTDVRVIAATNLDLLHATREGKFREDLFYRLSVVRISLPPLRDRVEDVPQLAAYFLKRRCRERGLPEKELSPRALRVLLLHEWPGNVRELQSVVERAVLFTPGATVDAEHILFDEDDEVGQVPDSYEEAKKGIVERFQRTYIERLLADTGGNISEAARRAGVTRAALHRMLKRLGSGSGDA